MVNNELVPRDFWPRIPSLWSEDFWPQVVNNSGLSLSEDDQHVYVETAVPGLDKDEINLSFHQGTLMVSGESKSEDQGRKQHRSMQRSFSYQVALPSTVRENADPKAELKNGVLCVTFDKAPEAKPKRIEITGD
jgi:HSP20 family protein